MSSWMREKIEPDEFVYFVFKMGGDDFYAVTDKRIIKSRHGKYEESSLKEVVSVGPPRVKTEFGIFAPSVTSFFEVNTFHGTIIFDGFSVQDAQFCGTLNAWIKIAVENYNTRKKDGRALILKLPLDRKQMFGFQAGPLKAFAGTLSLIKVSSCFVESLTDGSSSTMLKYAKHKKEQIVICARAKM